MAHVRNDPTLEKFPPLPPLTDQDVDRYRAMTPAERVAGCRMRTQARLALAHEARANHPEWDDAAVDREVLRAMLDG